MPASASRRSRPLSAGQLQELYGVPVPQLRNSEHAFHKELFKRDKERLKMRIAAIDNERRHVERKWNKEMSRFIRDYAEFMDSNRKKSANRKTRAMSSQLEHSISPSVPFIGTFSPSQPPVKDRWTGEIYHGLDIAHHEQDKFDYNANSANNRAERTPCQDNHRVHNNQHLSHSFHAASLLSARSSDTGNGAKEHFHRNSTNSYRTSSVDNMNQTPKNIKFQSWLSHNNDNNNHTFSQPLTGDKCEFIDSCHCMNRNIGRSNVSRACTMCGNNDKDNRNYCTVHMETVDNGNTMATNCPHYHSMKNSKRPGNKNATEDQKVARKRSSSLQPPQTGRCRSSSIVASRENDDSCVVKPQTGQRDAFSSGSSPSNDSGTSGSLDVEMLQRALEEHSSKCLIRNRWQRATQSVLLQLSDKQEDTTMKFPIHAFPLQAPPLSVSPFVSADPPLSVAPPVSSVGTPSSVAPTLSEASHSTVLAESQPDSGETVVQAILQLFKELEHTPSNSLTEVWPSKMDTLMTTIENLVKTTGVEIMDIVEKVQKEDLNDEKSAALLNWVKNVDATDQRGENDAIDMTTDDRRRRSVKFPAHYRETSYERSKHKDTNLKCTYDLKKPGEPSGGHTNQPSTLSSNIASLNRPSLRQAGKERPPVINVVLPSHGQSPSAEEENDRRRCQSVIADQLQNSEILLKSLQGRAEQHGRGQTPQPPLHSPTGSGKETEGLLLKRRSKSNDCRATTRARPPLTTPDDRRSSLSLLTRDVAVKHPSVEEHVPQQLPEMTPPPVASSSSPGVARMSHSMAEDSLLHCVQQKLSPRRAHADSVNRSPRQSRSSTRLSNNATSSIFSQQNARALSSNDSLRSKSPRKVSFSNLPTSHSTTNSDKKGKAKAQKGFTISDQRRSGTPSFIRPLSSQPYNNQTMGVHRRASSTDLKGPARRLSANGSVNRRNYSQRKPITCKLSSAVQQTKGSSQDRNMLQSSSQNDSSKCELPTYISHEGRQETIQTMLHTDRTGKTHLLTMRKVSLASTGIREANVFVTREDTSIKTPTGDFDNDQHIDHNNEDGMTGHRNSDIPEILVDEISSEDSVTRMIGDESDGSIPASPNRDSVPQTSLCHEEHIPEYSQPEAADPENTPEKADNEDCTAPDDEESLWRRRLTHPSTMPWVQELSSDHKAQGLALSLLQRKEMGGQKFRSTVLKVICVNALRAAKRVYDDVTFREMKHCRYLRMPESHDSDIQRSLSINEIFS